MWKHLTSHVDVPPTVKHTFLPTCHQITDPVDPVSWESFVSNREMWMTWSCDGLPQSRRETHDLSSVSCQSSLQEHHLQCSCMCHTSSSGDRLVPGLCNLFTSPRVVPVWEHQDVIIMFDQDVIIMSSTGELPNDKASNTCSARFPSGSSEYVYYDG